MKKYITYERAGWFVLFIGVGITIYFTRIFLPNFSEEGRQNTQVKIDVWGSYGDVVGGIAGSLCSLVGVLLLYETLRQQKEAFIIQQVETRLFELIRIHRDNVNEIESKGKKGRKVFINIKSQFDSCHESITDVYKQHNNTLDAIHQKECIQIAWLIVFFGVNNASDNHLITSIDKICTAEETKTSLFLYITKIKDDDAERVEKNGLIRRSKRKHLQFSGHQSRLAHYYRHLFQAVSYLNTLDSKIFSYEKKYEYSKIIRAQISNYEQAALLYNSISPLGQPWELTQTDKNKGLITKYDLIRNLPSGFTKLVDPKDYYPDVHYETQSEKELTANRKKLEREIYK